MEHQSERKTYSNVRRDGLDHATVELSPTIAPQVHQDLPVHPEREELMENKESLELPDKLGSLSVKPIRKRRVSHVPLDHPVLQDKMDLRDQLD